MEGGWVGPGKTGPSYITVPGLRCPYPALIRPPLLNGFLRFSAIYGSSCVLFPCSCILFALVASSSQSHTDFREVNVLGSQNAV